MATLTGPTAQRAQLGAFRWTERGGADLAHWVVGCVFWRKAGDRCGTLAPWLDGCLEPSHGEERTRPKCVGRLRGHETVALIERNRLAVPLCRPERSSRRTATPTPLHTRLDQTRTDALASHPTSNPHRPDLQRRVLLIDSPEKHPDRFTVHPSDPQLASRMLNRRLDDLHPPLIRSLAFLLKCRPEGVWGVGKRPKTKVSPQRPFSCPDGPNRRAH